jgi:hypothetical protein
MNCRTMLGRLLSAPAAVGMYASDAWERIEVGGAALDVSIDSDQFERGRTALLDWVTRSARAVTAYFAGSPWHTLAFTSPPPNMAAFPME